MQIFGPRKGPPGLDCSYPYMSTPVIVPFGCKAGCCDCCSPDGIPIEHVKTHARDTIIVSDLDAGVSIRLDDGSGLGYDCPFPVDCMELRLRFKGESCFVLTVHAIGIDGDGNLDIRWPPEWPRMRDGYYEGLIVFDPNSPSVRRLGGWLLFLKERPKVNAATASAQRIRPAPKPADDPFNGCRLEAPKTAVVPNDRADCGNEDCNPCL